MSPLPSLPCVELQTSNSPAASVIWLHGLGADGYDFVPVVRELESAGAPALRYVFPHAPMRAVTVNGGQQMRAWYDIVSADLVRREDASGVRQSQEQVQALIDHEVARGFASSRLFLAGFSQGGAIALHLGLRQQQPLAGILALSTYLPLADTFATERAAASGAVPVFMAHGTSDPVISLDRALSSRDALLAYGQPVKWHEYAMPHTVGAAEIRDIAAFLRATLN